MSLLRVSDSEESLRGHILRQVGRYQAQLLTQYVFLPNACISGNYYRDSSLVRRSREAVTFKKHVLTHCSIAYVNTCSRVIARPSAQAASNASLADQVSQLISLGNQSRCGHPLAPLKIVDGKR